MWCILLDKQKIYMGESASVFFNTYDWFLANIRHGIIEIGFIENQEFYLWKTITIKTVLSKFE